MRRWACSVSSVFVLSLLCGSDVGAGTLKIRPDQFRPQDTGDAYNATAERGIGPIRLVAPLDLPAGKTITKITQYAIIGSGGRSRMYLKRVKVGSWDQELAAAVADTEDPSQIQTVTSTDIDSPRVEVGYAYFLEVLLQSSQTLFYGAKVTYE